MVEFSPATRETGVRFPANAFGWLVETVHKTNLTSNSSHRHSKPRGHPGLNRRPLDLQSNALPLSYIPIVLAQEMLKNFAKKSDVLLQYSFDQ